MKQVPGTIHAIQRGLQHPGAVGFGALALVTPFVAPLLSHAFRQALETAGRIMQQLNGY